MPSLPLVSICLVFELDVHFKAVLFFAAHSTSLSFQVPDIPVADTAVSAKSYSITAELACKFASCREITLLLFSGNNFDNCP